jgi:hypothetical protein
MAESRNIGLVRDRLIQSIRRHLQAGQLMKNRLGLAVTVRLSHRSSAAASPESTTCHKQTDGHAIRRSTKDSGYAGANLEVQSTPLIREFSEDTALGFDRKGHSD